MILHDYYRSSSAYRVRIALNLKGVAYTAVPHHLRRGEQRAPDYLARNPNGLVPALEAEGETLVQSLAIVEYLEETHPAPALLPGDALGRARVRGLAQAIACDIHPIDNLRVLNRLRALGHDEAVVRGWYNYWIAAGFAALETALTNDPRTGCFCHGDTIGLADIFLVPQMFNAGNFGLDLAPYPTLRRIDAACTSLPEVAAAHPARQPDAE